MAFTYDPTTDRGRVRQMIGDRVEASALFTDAEVDAAMSDVSGSVPAAAANLLDALATEYARRGSFETDGQKVDNSKVSENYRREANRIRQDHGIAAGTGSGIRSRTMYRDRETDNSTRSSRVVPGLETPDAWATRLRGDG